MALVVHDHIDFLVSVRSVKPLRVTKEINFMATEMVLLDIV